MDDEKTPLNSRQANTSGRPFIVTQPDRPVPYPFNASAEDTSRSPIVETTSAPSKGVSKKKKSLLFILIATALLILGLGVVYVYWYQNPNKVVSDAAANALGAKSLTYTGIATVTGSTNIAARFDGGASLDGGMVNAKFTLDASDKKYTFDGSGILNSKNDLYLKVSNIDALVKNLLRVLPAETQKQFDQVFEKIDNKWVKISSADLKNYDADIAKMQKCTADAAKKIQTDKTVKSELMDAYKKHPFITIDKSLGASGGSLGYLLSSDLNTSKSFKKELMNTSLYKSLVKCDASFANKDEDLAKSGTDTLNADTKIELWVNRWDHQITKLVIVDESKDRPTNIIISPKFNQPVTVATPKESTTIQQLQTDVMQLLQGSQVAPAATLAP
jgi:hypothetical protein